VDQRTESVSIQYGAHSGPFKDTSHVIKSDSGKFRTVASWLDDACFANRNIRLRQRWPSARARS
jgi:hypothetical protein